MVRGNIGKGILLIDKRRRLIGVLLIAVLIWVTIPAALASPTYIEFHAGVRITPTGSGAILFDSTVQADSAYFTGAYICFTDLMVHADGYKADIWGASTSTNANLTINHLFETEYNLTVNAPTGNTSTTDIRMPTDALVSSVTGVTSWVQIGDIFSFIVEHSSPAIIIATVGGGAVVPPESDSVSAQNVFIEADYTDWVYPWNSTGVNGFTDGYGNTEQNYRLSYVRFPGDNPDIWNFTVTRMGFDVYRDAGYACDLEWTVYEVVNATHGGELWGYENQAVGNYPADEWFNNYLTVTVPSNEVGVYLGIGADFSVSGLHGVMYETINQSYGALYYNGYGYPDPLGASTLQDTLAYGIRMNVTANRENSTDFNQYYGTATHYTARRDIFEIVPTSGVVRQINMTLPIIEKIHNITYSHGDAWDLSLSTSEYSTSSYNGTHNMVTIPEGSIASYGANFRVYSKTYDYYGVLHGPYFENGTVYPSPVTVTMVSANGTDSVIVNGTDYTWATDDAVFMFYWSLQSGGVRRIYSTVVGENITVFMPEANYATYEFDIRDYTGKLDANAYLEAWRVVNSTECLIERSRILDAVNDVPLSLVQYAVYNIRVVFSDGTIYVFGYLVTGVDPTPTISIQDIQWGDQAHTTSTYITMDSTRTTPTTIHASYLDQTPADYSTTLVTLTITYRDGTLVYTTNQANSKSVVFSWSYANASRDYVVRITAAQAYYGQISRVWVLDASRSFAAFPDLDALGSWGFDTTNLLTFGVSLLVAACFSFAGRWLAPFAFMSTVGAFTYLGATDLSGTQVGIGFVLAIVMGAVLGGRDR